MSRLIRIFKMWADERFVQGEKNIGCKGREGALLAALTSLSSALSLVFKTIPRSLVVVTVGVVWVWGG